jgi:hypothetical protein
MKARKGSPAPGAPAGASYAVFDENQILLNDAGHIAFVAYLDGPGIGENAEALWAENSNGIALVARRGDHAPGTPDGVRFGEPGFWSFALSGFNEAGQVAFVGTLDGPDVDFTNNAGIWATDRTGALRLIARSGDVIEVSPGDFRTISFPFLRSGSLNNLGQVIFQASFTDDSSGLFVSNLVAIPEPASALLVALAIFATLTPRRGVVHNALPIDCCAANGPRAPSGSPD